MGPIQLLRIPLRLRTDFVSKRVVEEISSIAAFSMPISYTASHLKSLGIIQNAKRSSLTRRLGPAVPSLRPCSMHQLAVILSPRVDNTRKAMEEILDLRSGGPEPFPFNSDLQRSWLFFEGSPGWLRSREMDACPSAHCIGKIAGFIPLFILPSGPQNQANFGRGLARRGTKICHFKLGSCAHTVTGNCGKARIAPH